MVDVLLDIPLRDGEDRPTTLRDHLDRVALVVVFVRHYG